MTALEIKQLADAMAQNAWSPSWVHLLVTVAAVSLASFLGSYLAEKAKNTATKEDVARITHLVEGARLDYTAKIESVKGSYHLRAVALERRLEIHQEAFSRWRKLIFAVHTEQIGTVCRECEEWWTEHCVYLSSEARDAFIAAIGAAHGHQEYIRGRLPREKIEENWKTILDAGNAIMKGADLPPLPTEAFPAHSSK